MSEVAQAPHSSPDGHIPQLRFPEFSDEWKEKPLKDISTFFNGKAYKQAELLSSGKYPVLRVGNFFTNNSWYYSNLELDENKYCDNGDLLYAWSASFGPRIWVGEKVIYHYHIWKVINHSQVTKKFLFIVLDNETAKMKAQSANGFALLHITKGTIENWKVNLPVKPEQTKIAAFLIEVDNKIEHLIKKQELLGKYKKGLMQQIFSQTIRFKADDGSVFPDWEEKELGDVVNTIKNGTSIDQNSNGFGYAVTRIETISMGKINLNKIGYVDTDEDLGAFKLQYGDILFSNINSPAHIGKVAYVDKGVDLYHGMNLLLIRANHMILSPKFLHLFLIKRSTRQFFQKICNKAVNQASINQTDLKKTSIIFPELEEQAKIVNFLSSVDKKIEQVGKQLEESKQFKKALLQQMFI